VFQKQVICPYFGRKWRFWMKECECLVSPLASQVAILRVLFITLFWWRKLLECLTFFPWSLPSFVLILVYQFFHIYRNLEMLFRDSSLIILIYNRLSVFNSSDCKHRIFLVRRVQFVYMRVVLLFLYYCMLLFFSIMQGKNFFVGLYKPYDLGSLLVGCSHIARI